MAAAEGLPPAEVFPPVNGSRSSATPGSSPASTSRIALFGGGRLGASSMVGAWLIVGGAVVGTRSLWLAGRPGP